MVDVNNVNYAATNNYKSSVPKSAIEMGAIGAGVGAVSSITKNKRALKEFVTTKVKSDEFIKLTAKEKLAAVSDAKALRDNFKKIVLKDVGKSAAIAAGVGALVTIVTNMIDKNTAKKQEQNIQQA